MDSKIGIRDKIEEDELKYRIDNLVYSQSMLSTFKKNKAEFTDKYLRNIFWSDDTEKDREYEKNMSYGRDFHKVCERVFSGIPREMNSLSGKTEEINRIYAIKNQYLNMYGEDNVEFLPEFTIEMSRPPIQITIDLLVKVYKEGRLSKLFIWDWKVEDSNITVEKALKRMQTEVYMYVCRETLGKDVQYEDIVMYYYQPKKNKNTKIVYSESQHREFEKDILKTISEIKEIKNT